MLKAHVLCEGVGAGKGFVTFCARSDDRARTSGRVNSPGREHIKGFSPVCERMCEMSAKRDV